MKGADIGRLTKADESFNHQIVDTFATVSEADRSWTEKVWTSIARKDGALQIDFGLGKYVNRNVFDGFCGVARGREQWTVRASRALAADLEDSRVGPIRYEIVEPLKKIRYILEPNKVQPIAMDVLFEGETLPFFEERNRFRSAFRLNIQTLRFHQGGRMSGWLEIDGERYQLGDDWFGFRDRSWGVRGDPVGAIPTDIMPNQAISKNSRMMWGPMLLTRPDGSKYEIMPFFWGTDNWEYNSSHINNADGTQEKVRILKPTPRLNPKTRDFISCTFEMIMESGETRTMDVEALSDIGFHLRTGWYGGWKDGRHGVWRGDYFEDGEYFADVGKELPILGQFRDRPVRCREGNATGYGIQESVFHGNFPELGLGPESDFPTNLY